MRITLICVGRLKSGPERELFERYFARLKAMARSAGVTDVDVREIDESRARRPDDRREDEAAALHKSLGPRDVLVALDERASLRRARRGRRTSRVRETLGSTAYVVVIGGPDGLSASLRTKALRVIGFGAMTWPHQLVRVMAAEQLYRALSILSGHPYHRA